MTGALICSDSNVVEYSFWATMNVRILGPSTKGASCTKVLRCPIFPPPVKVSLFFNPSVFQCGCYNIPVFSYELLLPPLPVITISSDNLEVL